ncbi:RecQ-mediated genome instability protein 1 [Nymphon striatum]|nr:RecQ-mediated genome instability protein 1 [Nymphon striatum]
MENAWALVKKMLLTKNKINVPDDWAQSCVEWICQDQAGGQLPINQLYSMVYEQWLVSNLTELCVSVLPDNVSETKSQLDGYFCLQLNAILDVSQPYFQQIVQFNGGTNDNVEISDVREPAVCIPAFKASRMLLMELTDGCRVVKGLEYKPIPSLNTDIPPGVKIALKGSIECRRNILFLKEENVQILGGSVDEIAEQNKQEKLLMSALGTDSLDEDSLRCWNQHRNLRNQDPVSRSNSNQATNIQPSNACSSGKKRPCKQQAKIDSFVVPKQKEPKIIVDDGMSDDLLDELCAAMEEDF